MSILSTPEDAPVGAVSQHAQAAESEPEPEAPSPADRARRERALLLVTLILIVAASVAFLRAQSLKLEPSALKRPRVESYFSPTCRCGDKTTADLSFGLRRPSRVDAQVIDAESRRVRTLVAGVERPTGRSRLAWDGRDDLGQIARDGTYRLRLVLDGEREVIVPSPINLDTRAPTAVLVGVSPQTIRAPRRGRAARSGTGRSQSTPIEVRYRSDEAGRATLFVGDRAAARTARRRAGSETLTWDGLVDGRPLRPGRYELSVRVQDRAGNLGPSPRRLPLRVRRPSDRR